MYFNLVLTKSQYNQGVVKEWNAMDRKLCKNRDRRMLSGVLAGFSDYLGIDVTILRIGFVIVAIFTEIFPLLILYVILAVLMPDCDKELINERQDKSYGPEVKEDPWKRQEHSEGPRVERKNEGPAYRKAGGSYVPKDDGYGPEGYREVKEDDKVQ
jgi:phage shock protein C